MSDTLVYRPEKGHRCDATIRGQWDPVGSVRRCEVCGTYWRAVPFRQPYSNLHIVQDVEWVRESRLRRWWRERRARR
jgi:hypothetical protein